MTLRDIYLSAEASYKNVTIGESRDFIQPRSLLGAKIFFKHIKLHLHRLNGTSVRT